jgi:hypothetical protein
MHWRANRNCGPCWSQIAEEDRNPSALTAAERAIAEIRGIGVKNINISNGVDYAKANSMQEIGCMLLRSVGFHAPDELSIKQAIELNDVFVAGLERIRDANQTPNTRF